jgi:cell division septum initiation protein DivIVA
MREHTDTRSPEEIESDIERTRADFSSTIEAIQYKLTPREIMDNAVDYALSTTPGAFSVNLVNSVRSNPVPVALIGIGVAWLIAAGRQGGYARRYPHTARRSSFYPEGDVMYESGADQDYYSSARGSSGEGMLQRAASKTSETARGLKDRANETANDLRDKASEVGQRIGSTASEMTERVQQAGQSARSRLAETAGSAQARVSEMGQRSQMEYYRAKERVGNLVDEQPLMIGALGIALGAALGAALPVTRRENELMGGTRDDLLGRVKETALEQAETVKQSAQRVAEVAKQEAERVKEDVSKAATQGKEPYGSTPGQQSIH